MAEKFFQYNETTGNAKAVEALVVSTGGADDGKLVALGADGKLDESVMPTGVGADVSVVQASEALAAGDAVNIWNSGGARVRKADAATGKKAHGFVKAVVSSGAMATVYHEGANGQVTGLTGGDVFLSATTPGAVTNTPPDTAGHIVQHVGVATSATSYNFEGSGLVIEL